LASEHHGDGGNESNSASREEHCENCWVWIGDGCAWVVDLTLARQRWQAFIDFRALKRQHDLAKFDLRHFLLLWAGLHLDAVGPKFIKHKKRSRRCSYCCCGALYWPCHHQNSRHGIASFHHLSCDGLTLCTFLSQIELLYLPCRRFAHSYKVL
jgi:hypothetical protein